jgi:zinc protease
MNVAVSASPADIQRVVSPQGIEAWLVESYVVPLIALSFSFEGGAAQDGAHHNGSAKMMAALLEEGAGPYSSDAFQEKLAARAIELSFGASSDAVSGSLKTLTQHQDEAFQLLHLALTQPRFDVDAIERVRAQTVAGIRYASKDPDTMASKRFYREAFLDHPYGLPSSGTLDSVSLIERQNITGLHQKLLARDQLKIAVVGAINAETLAQKLDEIFGDLPSSSGFRPVPITRLAQTGGTFVEDLDVPQSVIRFAMDGLFIQDEDFIPAFVLNHILGGGAFTSRLFQEVREKRGLAYSIGTSLSSYRGAAMLSGYTATKNERVSECLSVIKDDMEQLFEQGPSEDELTKAKDYLTGSYLLGFDTSTKIARQLSFIAFENLGLDYITRRNALVSAVTMEDVMRVSSRLKQNKILVVIAGRPANLTF